MKRLQEEHRVWVAGMYPDQVPMLPAVSMIEEAGELLHALLKLEQSSVFGEDPRYPEDVLQAQLVDGVGDCAISCCSLCDAVGWDFENVCNSTGRVGSKKPLELGISLVRTAADLADSLPKCDVYCWMYMSLVKAIADLAGVDFESAVQQTWDTVKQRRRTATPRPTVVCLCGSVRFREAFERAEEEEAKAGRIVMTVGCFGHSGAVLTDAEKVKLDELHLRKIDAADEVLVIDPECLLCEQCGKPCNCVQFNSNCCYASASVGTYVDESTSRGIAYAASLGKRVRRLSEERT